jgi:hypothetical protein
MTDKKDIQIKLLIKNKLIICALGNLHFIFIYLHFILK